MKKVLRKATTVTVASIYILTNAVLGAWAESNLWMQRSVVQRSKSDSLAALPPLSALSLRSEPAVPSSTASRARLRALVPASAQMTLLPLLEALPQNVGTVRKVSSPDHAARIVIYIQDVHRNQEAQKNIGQAVQALIDKSAVDLVALEGAFAPLDFSWARAYPHRKAVDAVADWLLRQNYISGPVQRAFVSRHPIPAFIGVDDKPHYDGNVQAYRQSSALAAAYKQRLERQAQGFNQAKAQIFNPQLRDFDRRVEAYRRGVLSWGDYVYLLSQRHHGFSPKVQLFLSALALERRLDLPRVETERAGLLNRLVTKLDPAALQRLVTQSAASRAGNLSAGDFYTSLQALCANSHVSLAGYSALNQYMRYVQLSDVLDIDAILKEVSAAETKIYRALAESTAEQQLLDAVRLNHLTAKLLDFSLTKEEWIEYKSSSIQFPLSNFHFPNLSPFERFYSEAEARDEAMARNLEKAIDASHAKVAVLVAGGFHCEGMTSVLRSKGFAVVSYVPKVTHIDGENGSAYLNIFTQEKTPLDRLFAGEKLFLAGEQRMALAAVQPLTDATDLAQQNRAGHDSERVLSDGNKLIVHVAEEGHIENVSTRREPNRRQAMKKWMEAALPGVALVMAQTPLFLLPTSATEQLVQQSNEFQKILETRYAEIEQHEQALASRFKNLNLQVKRLNVIHGEIKRLDEIGRVRSNVSPWLHAERRRFVEQYESLHRILEIQRADAVKFQTELNDDIRRFRQMVTERDALIQRVKAAQQRDRDAFNQNCRIAAMVGGGIVAWLLSLNILFFIGKIWKLNKLKARYLAALKSDNDDRHQQLKEVRQALLVLFKENKFLAGRLAGKRRYESRSSLASVATLRQLIKWIASDSQAKQRFKNDLRAKYKRLRVLGKDPLKKVQVDGLIFLIRSYLRELRLSDLQKKSATNAMSKITIWIKTMLGIAVLLMATTSLSAAQLPASPPPAAPPAVILAQLIEQTEQLKKILPMARQNIETQRRVAERRDKALKPQKQRLDEALQELETLERVIALTDEAALSPLENHRELLQANCRQLQSAWSAESTEVAKLRNKLAEDSKRLQQLLARQRTLTEKIGDLTLHEEQKFFLRVVAALVAIILSSWTVILVILRRVGPTFDQLHANCLEIFRNQDYESVRLVELKKNLSVFFRKHPSAVRRLEAASGRGPLRRNLEEAVRCQIVEWIVVDPTMKTQYQSFLHRKYEQFRAQKDDAAGDADIGLIKAELRRLKNPSSLMEHWKLEFNEKLREDRKWWNALSADAWPELPIGNFLAALNLGDVRGYRLHRQLLNFPDAKVLRVQPAVGRLPEPGFKTLLDQLPALASGRRPDAVDIVFEDKTKLRPLAVIALFRNEPGFQPGRLLDLRPYYFAPAGMPADQWSASYDAFQHQFVAQGSIIGAYFGKSDFFEIRNLIQSRQIPPAGKFVYVSVDRMGQIVMSELNPLFGAHGVDSSRISHVLREQIHFALTIFPTVLSPAAAPSDRRYAVESYRLGLQNPDATHSAITCIGSGIDAILFIAGWNKAAPADRTLDLFIRDISPWALAAAEENICRFLAQNGLGKRVRIHAGAGPGFPEGKFDTMSANLPAFVMDFVSESPMSFTHAVDNVSPTVLHTMADQISDQLNPLGQSLLWAHVRTPLAAARFADDAEEKDDAVAYATDTTYVQETFKSRRLKAEQIENDFVFKVEHDDVEELENVALALAACEVQGILGPPQTLGLESIGQIHNDVMERKEARLRARLLSPAFQRKLKRILQPRSSARSKLKPGSDEQAAPAAFVFGAPKSNGVNSMEFARLYKIAVTASLIRYGALRGRELKIFFKDERTRRWVEEAVNALEIRFGSIRVRVADGTVSTYRDIEDDVRGVSVLIHPGDFNGTPPKISVNFEREFLLPLRNLQLNPIFESIRHALIAA